MYKILVTLACLSPFLSVAAQPEAIKTENFSIADLEVPAYVTTFQHCFVDDNKRVIAVLSDGSNWIIPSKNPDATLIDIFQHWQVGDDIRIKEGSKDATFVLKSTFSPVFYTVKLDRKHIGTSLYWIDRMDKNGYCILANDETQWVIGWLDACKTQYWEDGEALIINKGHYSRGEDYLIINRHTGESCWASQIQWK